MPIEEPKGVTAATANLLADWLRPARQARGPWLVSTTTEPGTIALRARWHYLRGLAQGEVPERQAHAVTAAQWQQEIDLESEGDLALIRLRLEVARNRFTRLRECASHPVAVVEAEIGLGDAARTADDMAAARSHYEAAAALARRIGFAFGVIRAQLPLAYLVRRSGSAEQMLALAQECRAAAETIADEVYVANALVAAGEALDVLGRHHEAIDVLTEAITRFSRVGSDVGLAGAGIRLADVHRQTGDDGAILDLAPTVLAAIERTGMVQEAVDLHDQLATAHITRGALDQAIEHCQRAIALAGSAYPRGVAHVDLTLGTALHLGGDPEAAAAAFVRALDYFDPRPDDDWNTAYCLGHLADCAEDLDRIGDAVTLRLHAVHRMDRARASQTRPQWQQEYRDRFADILRKGLQTAIAADDAPAFAAVFESVWGRRLVGLAEDGRRAADSDPVLLAQLIARNDRARRAGLAPDEDRATRLRRALGRVSLSAALPDRYENATAQALAASYRPLDVDEALTLLAGIRPDVALLLVTVLPGDDAMVVWLAGPPGGPPVLGRETLTATQQDAIAALSGTWPTGLLPDAVADLAVLVPEPLRDLPEQTRVQIVALDALWSVPWSAIPVRQDLLGTRCAVALSPSLSLAASTGPALPAALPHDARTVCCIGPDVAVHDLRGLGAASVTAREPGPRADAHAALLDRGHDGGVDAVVVLAHGRPAPALGHYLELGPDDILTPAEMYACTPPGSAALLACWGAQTPGGHTGEPVTLATLAFARGTRQVLTTLNELGDTVFARAVVNDTLDRARQDPWPEALRWALARRRQELPATPLIDWAALTTLGAW